MTGELMVLNHKDFMERLDNNYELFYELVGDFFDIYPETLGKLENSLESLDYELIHMSAHTLKGSISTLGGDLAAEYALHLEQMGRDKEISNPNEVLKLFKQAIQDYLLSAKALSQKNSELEALNNVTCQ
jgi:HPt (histidine-containing phosphotransfer) domain-containing protein